MEILYRTKKVEKLCSDYQKAKQAFAKKEADKLFKCIQYINAAKSLQDIKKYPPYSNLKKLKGDRKHSYSLAFNSTRSSYRLIFVPLDDDNSVITDDNTIRLDENITKIKILEVSKHYE